MRSVPPQSLTSKLYQAYEAGQFDLLENLARELVEAFPEESIGWRALGAALQGQGRWLDSLPVLRNCVLLLPGDAEAHNNLALTLQNLGELPEAERCYRKALKLEPDFTQAHLNLGTLLSAKGDHERALACYRQAIQRAPAFVQAHNNLGNTLQIMGKHEEALLSLRRAVEIDPEYAEGHYNLGVTLESMKKLEDAESSYLRAISLQPTHWQALENLGSLYRDCGRILDAQRCDSAVIALRPDQAGAHCNLGNTWKSLGRFDDAQRCYRAALALDSGFHQAHSNLLFSLNYVESLSVPESLEEARRFGARLEQSRPVRFDRWLCEQRPEKLRVGFVSGDFRQHPVAYFLFSALAKLSRKRLDLVAFSTSREQDHYSRKLKPLFSSWVELQELDDAEAAITIHEFAPHILIDLSGHTAHNRLPVFACRPAPVQATWLGYFATTGVAEMDYIIGDPHVTPPGEESHFTERIWRMPKSYLCFTAPEEEVVVNELPALSRGYVCFGCFNNLSKVNDAVVALWSRVLQQVPNSKLFLKSAQLVDPGIVRTTIDRFAARGIQEDRLVLEGGSERIEYLRAYHQVDIALDTFPYPGGTTSAEGLWMGVPVLTRKGDRFIAHNGESIAHNSGQSEWIAQDETDFVLKACRFAADLEALAELRRGLRGQLLASSLCDAERFSVALEEALWGMWEERNRPDQKLSGSV